MKICDRCEAKTITMILTNSKEGIHYDLCKKCEEDFYRFMKIPIEKPEKESVPGDKPENKKGPGRPKKNAKD